MGCRRSVTYGNSALFWQSDINPGHMKVFGDLMGQTADKMSHVGWDNRNMFFKGIKPIGDPGSRPYPFGLVFRDLLHGQHPLQIPFAVVFERLQFAE